MSTPTLQMRRRGPALLGLLVALDVVAFTGVMTTTAGADPTSPNLGTAAEASVVAASTVTNVPPSVLQLGLDLYPGTAVTGSPIVLGTEHLGGPFGGPAQIAQADLTTAYNAAAGASMTQNETGRDLGGQTLVSGVYTASSSMGLTGTLTLKGGPSSVFIFQAGSTLTTASSSSVVLVGGVQACNVWWQVGSSATLGTTTRFVGNIMANASVTITHGATIYGRAMARTGAVTLDNNIFYWSPCNSAAPVTTTTSPKSTKPTGAPPASTVAPTLPVASTVPSGLPKTPLALTSTTGVPAVVGPPRTGGAPLQGQSSPWLPILIVSLLGSGAMASGFGLRALRRLQQSRR